MPKIQMLLWSVRDQQFLAAHRLALEKATDNTELSEQLGLPLTPGPWYNASIGMTHRENMANCQFTLVGSKHSSDIYMRVGSCSPILQNWQLHVCLPGMLCCHNCISVTQLESLSTAPDSHRLYFLAGCEDQGASKYFVV